MKTISSINIARQEEFKGVKFVLKVSLVLSAAFLLLYSLGIPVI